MSLVSALTDLQTLLQTIDGWHRTVSLYDYSILDQARPHAIIIEPGPLEFRENTYGGFDRMMGIKVRIFCYYDGAGISKSTKTMVETIDLIDNKIIDNVYLGGTENNPYLRATLRTVTDPTVESREAGQASHEWLMATAIIVVEEEVREGASAQ